eukprot:scaffold437924_cov52-Prasinocladus_malaysianus.AAC.1
MFAIQFRDRENAQDARSFKPNKAKEQQPRRGPPRLSADQAKKFKKRQKTSSSRQFQMRVTVLHAIKAELRLNACAACALATTKHHSSLLDDYEATPLARPITHTPRLGHNNLKKTLWLG